VNFGFENIPSGNPGKSNSVVSPHRLDSLRSSLRLKEFEKSCFERHLPESSRSGQQMAAILSDLEKLRADLKREARIKIKIHFFMAWTLIHNDKSNQLFSLRKLPCD
jgi:hypothetical protein